MELEVEALAELDGKAHGQNLAASRRVPPCESPGNNKQWKIIEKECWI
jgi:hypothetical protein